MAAALVQSTGAQNGTASAAFPGSVTAGNLIVVSGGVNGVTDSAGNTYHLAVSKTDYLAVAIYYAYNVSGGSVTVTPSFNGHNQWVAEEWSGFGSLDPLAGTGTTSGPNPATVTATPAATSDGCAVCAISCFNGFGSPSGMSGTNPATWTTRMGFGFVGNFSASGAHVAGTVYGDIAYGGGAVNVDVALAYFSTTASGAGGSSGGSHPGKGGIGKGGNGGVGGKKSYGPALFNMWGPVNGFGAA